MASPKPNNISVAIRDYGGYAGVVTARAEFGGGDTVTGIQGALQAWLNLVSGACGAQILACRYEMDIPLTAPASTKAATLGAPLVRGLLANFPNTVNDDPYSVFFPAVEPSLAVGGKPDNTEGATIDLLLDFMENGAAGNTPMAGTTGGFFVNRANSHLGPTGFVRLADRKHRQQLQSGSKVSGQ